MILYAAKHLLPVSSPPIQSGAVVAHEGRIVAVGRRRDLLKAHADAEVRDLGDAVLIPGLVNAHTHIELSWMNGEPPAGGSYMTWLEDLIARRGSIEEATARAAASSAIESMLARGTVAIGDVANQSWAAPLLASSRLAGTVFLEIFGFKSGDAESILDAAAGRLEAIDATPEMKAAKGRISAILTPHAAQTTSAPLLKALGGRAAAAGEALSIHVAESIEESQLLRDGTGPFRDLLIRRGAWDDAWKAPGLTPVEYLDRLGVLSPRTLAVHCVHLDHHDLTRLQARGVTVVTCPRSNQRLGVGKAPIPKLLASGIPVALGTDSLASSPDVDVFNEVAVLRQEHPGLAPAAALRIATLNGARALGLAKDLGTIEPGKSAALAVVGLPDPNDDPLEAVTWTSEQVFALDGAPFETVAR
ncbi:MAG TPA: amidohydrolase family protein [Candidatus Polarisedimenticolaceae bacterium]|nr:amidohydrolase family protein [Candidatus Polarisedimenticolaceae bacterium]